MEEDDRVTAISPYIEKQIDLSFDFIKFIGQLFVLLVSAYLLIFTGMIAYESSETEMNPLTDLLRDIVMGLTVGLLVVGWIFFGLVVKASGRLRNALAAIAPQEERIRLQNIKSGLLMVGFLFAGGMSALLVRIILFVYELGA